jgi:Flp pilus assembly protein TadG
MSKRRREDGAAAVEFAMVLPIFIFLMFGIIQFGFYFWTAETANSAAREAARRVVVGDCWDNTKMTNYVRSQSPRMSSTSKSVDPSTLTVGSAITVTVTANSNILNFFPVPSTVTREYVARMEVDKQSTAANDTCTGY